MTGIAYYTLQADGFGGCGHHHRTLLTAESCLERNRRRYKLLPGGNSYCPWQIDAYDSDGRKCEEAWLAGDE